jgi:hypothetical protein
MQPLCPLRRVGGGRSSQPLPGLQREAGTDSLIERGPRPDSLASLISRTQPSSLLIGPDIGHDIVEPGLGSCSRGLNHHPQVGDLQQRLRFTHWNVDAFETNPCPRDGGGDRPPSRHQPGSGPRPLAAVTSRIPSSGLLRLPLLPHPAGATHPELAETPRRRVRTYELPGGWPPLRHADERAGPRRRRHA